MKQPIEVVESRIGPDTAGRRTAAAPRRIRVAEVLAFIGLVAAFVGAFGPAERVRTTYSWPPPTLPAGTPDSIWYSPLLLAQRTPESVTVNLPCATPQALPNASRPIAVFATARFPDRVGGLSITSSAQLLSVAVGGHILTRVPLVADGAADRPCSYVFQATKNTWSMTGGPSEAARGGGLSQMPIVNGLFSAVDVRSQPQLSASVTTRVHATRTITRQAIAWILAALAIAAALVLVAVETRPTGIWWSARRAARSVLAAARLVDGVVLAVLAGWWVLSPAFWDDGWVIARQSGFSVSRGFSNYYDTVGANLPNGYWLEWLQHWLTQS